MKYVVHYYVEGFRGQKEYFENLKKAKKYVICLYEKLENYAEDIEIIKL